MRRNTWLPAALVLAMSFPAFAETPPAKAWDQTSARVTTGEQRLAKARNAKTNARRLEALDQAISSFKTARRAAIARRTSDLEGLRVSAERGLVDAYDSKAQIYYERGSLSKARDAVVLALDIDPSDSRAQNLVLLIDAASGTDLFTKYQGTAAIERIQERRATAGGSIRPRGLTGRR